MRLATTRLARRLRQRAGSGLSPTLGAALATIDRHGPLTPSQLADRERVRRPTATRIVARLTEQGLLVREDNPDDRRSHRVAISPAGAAVLRDARERKAAYLAQALEHLSPDEQHTLDRAAAIIERILEEDRA